MCNPYTELPLALPPPARVSLDTTVAEKTPQVLPPSHPQARSASNLTLALAGPNAWRCDLLETPATLDDVNKARNVAVTKAKKQTKAVNASAAANGSNALSEELGQPGDNTDKRGAPAEPEPNTVSAANAPVAKQHKRRAVMAPNPPVAAPIETAPLEDKCQGCIHCDLLELKQMEPTRIRHYLQRHEFLERAKCAGDCGLSIKEIFNATKKKADLYYCDFGKKGFDAPESDREKATMECGLVLCLACHGKRADAYAQANAQAGGSTHRSTRRRNR
jgi:hypothetical protein